MKEMLITENLNEGRIKGNSGGRTIFTPSP